MLKMRVGSDETPFSCAFPTVVHLVWVCVYGEQGHSLFACLSSGSTCVCVCKESDAKRVLVVVDSYVLLC